MQTKYTHFKLTRQAMLLGLISAAYPMAGYSAIAGKADFVLGSVEAVNTDGSRRQLSKGSPINEGDAIRTTAGARAQLRFVDGGYVSLQPDTQFRVDQFNFKNKEDGTEKGFFSLLKGSLRAITGSIGHTNRDSYKVVTPSATIGIRGTGYKAEVRDDGLLVSVGEGAILLSNNAGAIVVTSGNAAFVANKNTMPIRSNEHPNTPPARIEPLSGSNNALTQQPELPKMQSGSGYQMAYAYHSSTLNGQTAISNVTATFNNTSQASQMTSYTSSTADNSSLGNAAITFAATDGIIGWGRWDGNTTASGNLMAPGLISGAFHYVIGIPTAVMPTGSATYSMMGYTNPSASDNSTGWKVTGNLNVNFSGGQVSFTMKVWNATDIYNTSGGGTNLTGSNFTTGGASTTSSTGSCGTGCTTSINGFFAGTGASRAGLSYSIIGASQTVEGAAAFAKN
jgi:hypothetical protein